MYLARGCFKYPFMFFFYLQKYNKDLLHLLGVTDDPCVLSKWTKVNLGN